MAQAVIRVKQRFRMINFSSGLSRIWNILIPYYLSLKQLQFFFYLFPVEKTKNLSVYLQYEFKELFTCGLGFLYVVYSFLFLISYTFQSTNFHLSDWSVCPVYFHNYESLNTAMELYLISDIFGKKIYLYRSMGVKKYIPN